MKMKSTITAALLLIAPLYANAQSGSGLGGGDPWTSQPQRLSRNGDAIPTGARIEMKMKQIELDVAMKQFEKIQTALAETRVEAQLLDEALLGEGAYHEQTRRAEVKTARLMNLKKKLQEEILENVAVIEKYRKEYALTDEPVTLTAETMNREPRPALPRPGSLATPQTGLPGPSFNYAKPAPAKQPDVLPRIPDPVAPAAPSTPVAR